MPDSRGASVLNAKKNDARCPVFGKGKNFAKIEIERKQNTFFRAGFSKYVGVRRLLEALLPEVHCVMPEGAQLANDFLRDPHVGQEAHDDGSARHHAFLRQPGGIFEGLLNVVWFEVRVLL